MFEQPCRRKWGLREENGTEYIYGGVRFLNSRDLYTIAYANHTENFTAERWSETGARFWVGNKIQTN